MRLSYQEERAAQLAARIAKLAGGRINHMRLIKLMYLVERTSLARFGRPVSFDWLVAMRNGPVLSATLDRINEPAPRDESSRSYWQRLFSPRENHEVSLLMAQPPADALSRAEVALIDEIFAQFGSMDQWQLVDWCHEHCPEWEDPGLSRAPINLRKLLASEGYDDDEIEEILEDIAAESQARELIG